MKNASLFLVLFCIGAPACAMLKTEQDLPLVDRYIQECLKKPEFKSEDDLKPLVDAYVKECILPRAQSVILEDEADVNYGAHLLLLQRGQKRSFAASVDNKPIIVPFVCANPGCGRAFCAQSNFSHHSKSCRFKSLGADSEPLAIKIAHANFKHECSLCHYRTRSLLEFKKHILRHAPKAANL